MRVTRLLTENFKIIKAVDITPEGNLVAIGGKNGQGKSSVLDAIWVALEGKAVAPPVPIRKGEQKCTIRLELGEGDATDLIITRTFTENQDNGKVTDSVKVESGDGRQRFNSPQSMLDSLLGSIGFDPFAFVQRKPEDQAAMLLEMVPLSIDLEAMAREDAADYENRRDINRDAESLRSQIAAIPLDESVPTVGVDRQAILNQLSSAADTNSAIERERMRRESEGQIAERLDASAALKRSDAGTRREEAAQLIREAETLEAGAAEDDQKAAERRAAVEALPALDAPVNTDQLRTQLEEAEVTNAKIARQGQRRDLAERLQTLEANSKTLSDRLNDRDHARKAALTKAKMPIEGLAFVLNEKGKPVVELGGVPFQQASTADQIKASTAIAMSANPELRVLRIKDGSLLDDDSMAIIAKMAADEDYQLWVEKVGTGGVGIVIENGEVAGAKAEEAPADAPAPKAKGKAKAEEPPKDKLL